MKNVLLFLAIVSFSAVAGTTDIIIKPVALTVLKKTVLNILIFVKRLRAHVMTGLLYGKKRIRVISFI